MDPTPASPSAGDGNEGPTSSKTAYSQNYDAGLLERLLFRVAKRWVAGNGTQDAIEAARVSNIGGMAAILNFLGEETSDPKLVEETVNEYISLMDLMQRNGIDGCVSVKPSQIGLAIDYATCLQNFTKLASKAKSLNRFLWMDMESIRFTEATIEIYLEILEVHEETGLAIQSYLKRSAGDLMHILEHLETRGKVRLVKGAYHESEDHAFSSKEDIDLNYSKLMQMLFKSNAFFAIATHDSKLIDEAIHLAEDVHWEREKKRRFEFQFLMGIRDDLKKEFAGKFKVSEYIPYGNQWLPYSVRRIREKKSNLLLLARSLI